MPNERNNLASPSPITDGKNVWFYFGTGDLAAFDADGKPLWERNIQKDYGKFPRPNGSMPPARCSSTGNCTCRFLHRSDDSYLLALDPMTGKELWEAAAGE